MDDYSSNNNLCDKFSMKKPLAKDLSNIKQCFLIEF